MDIELGKWEYSELYRDCVVAKDWGKTPMEFWKLDPLDRAFMIATSQASGSMSAFENKIASKD